MTSYGISFSFTCIVILLDFLQSPFLYFYISSDIELVETRSIMEKFKGVMQRDGGPWSFFFPFHLFVPVEDMLVIWRINSSPLKPCVFPARVLNLVHKNPEQIASLVGVPWQNSLNHSTLTIIAINLSGSFNIVLNNLYKKTDWSTCKICEKSYLFI